MTNKRTPKDWAQLYKRGEASLFEVYAACTTDELPDFLIAAGLVKPLTAAEEAQIEAAGDFIRKQTEKDLKFLRGIKPADESTEDSELPI